MESVSDNFWPSFAIHRWLTLYKPDVHPVSPDELPDLYQSHLKKFLKDYDYSNEILFIKHEIEMVDWLLNGIKLKSQEKKYFYSILNYYKVYLEAKKVNPYNNSTLDNTALIKQSNENKYAQLEEIFSKDILDNYSDSIKALQEANIVDEEFSIKLSASQSKMAIRYWIQYLRDTSPIRILQTPSVKRNGITDKNLHQLLIKTFHGFSISERSLRGFVNPKAVSLYSKTFDKILKSKK
jgi:hypothetical protein